MEIKYHLDESVANAVANGLGHRGIDVTTSKAAGLIGASDLQQLDKKETGRLPPLPFRGLLSVHSRSGRRRTIRARKGLSCLCPLSPNIRQVLG
jgi:hypothetical protein